MDESGVRRRVTSDPINKEYYDEDLDEEDDFVDSKQLQSSTQTNNWYRQTKLRKNSSTNRQMQYSMRRLAETHEPTGKLTTAQLAAVVGISSVIMILLVIINSLLEE